MPREPYGDRFAAFVRNDAYWTLEEELQGHQHPTHLKPYASQQLEIRTFNLRMRGA